MRRDKLQFILSEIAVLTQRPIADVEDGYKAWYGTITHMGGGE